MKKNKQSQYSDTSTNGEDEENESSQIQRKYELQ
jgi:hypothetical protein